MKKTRGVGPKFVSRAKLNTPAQICEIFLNVLVPLIVPVYRVPSLPPAERVLRNITLVARRKLASLIDYRALHILGYARRPEVPQCLAFTYVRFS